MESTQERILIVDDDYGIRFLFETILSACGYECATAGDGAEALGLLDDGPITLALLDINMPGMTGLKLFQKIQELHPDTGVVFISGIDDVGLAVDQMKGGGYDYIVKPVGKDRLIESVRDALVRGREHMEARSSQAKFESKSESHVALLTVRERELSDLNAAPDGTATILFSDIEGFTQMTERLGDLRAQQVLRGHNDIMRQQVAAFGGFEVKSLGDGFMLAFSSARRALQCAIAVQRALAAHSPVHLDEPVHVGIGLHTGEMVREMKDYFGKGVILASRIADQAQGGEILVSSLVKELTESAGDIRFGEVREVELKGLSGACRVYPVEWK